MGLGIFQPGLATNRKTPPKSELAFRLFITMHGAQIRVVIGHPKGQEPRSSEAVF